MMKSENMTVKVLWRNSISVLGNHFHIFAFFCCMLLTACGTDSGHFKVEGHLLNMNQADFYVYSPDGAINGIDTIHVNGGRFTYSRPIMREGTIVVVFPNYKQQPVFVKPGSTIDFEGSAAKLKDLEVTGTEENDDFTEWRMNTNELSPFHLQQQAKAYIKKNPGTLVSAWMQRYIIPRKQKVGVNATLPRFTAKDINGNSINSQSLMKDSAMIIVWASWNHDSQAMLRRMGHESGYKVVTICLDADVKTCRRVLKDCNAEGLQTICDGEMLQSPLVKTLGIYNIPDNIRLVRGKVTGRMLPLRNL